MPVQTFREATGGSHFLRYHGVVDLPREEFPAAPGGSIPSAGDVRVFQVLADQDMLPGNQIVEDYGDASNYVYLHHHGFLPVYNPFDCVQLVLPSSMKRPANITVAQPSSWLSRWTTAGSTDASTPLTLVSDEEYEKLAAVLRFKGVNAPTACLRAEPLPQHVQHLMQLRFITPAPAAACLKLAESYTAATEDGYLQDAPLLELRSRCLDALPLPAEAWTELTDIAQKALDVYPTTEDNDNMMLRLGSLPCNKGEGGTGSSCGAAFFRMSENEQ